MCSKIILSISIFITGIILVSLGAGLGWGVFPNVVETQVAEEVALKNGSAAWDLWVELPIPIYFKIYFLTVDNPGPVSNGKKPVLIEKGPYVYVQERKKFNISIVDNGKNATYYQNITMKFNSTLSCEDCTEKDKITILNSPLMGAILTTDLEGVQASIDILEKAIPQVFDHPTTVFGTHTVDEWLFSGVRLRCDGNFARIFCADIRRRQLDAVIREDEESDDLLFSFFWKKNNTNDGLYKVDLGIDDPKKLAQIYEWNGSPTLPFWGGPKCNEIKGTDAAIFSAFNTPETIINIFSTDLCRSMYSIYEKEIVYKDIPGLRYIATSDQLATPTEDPDNYCWCADHSGCPKRGSTDLYPCQKAPVVLTWPHFFEGPSDFSDAVTGLNPSVEAHQTYVDLEPLTGVPLSGTKRVQLNMMTKKVEGISLTNTLPEALLPMIWIDEGSDLTDEYVKQLQQDLINPLNALDITRWTLIGVGIAGVLIGPTIYMIYWIRKE